VDERFQVDRPIDEKPLVVSRRLLLAILSSATIFPVVFCVLLKPTTAQAAWTTFAQLVQIEGPAAGQKSLDISSVNWNAFAPQEQAEFLLNAAINRSPEAPNQIIQHADSWRGRLKTTPELSGFLDTALSSSDLKVRAAAIETELAANDLAKTLRVMNGVIARVNNEPSVRPWGLWMLGALGNRGVQPDRALTILVAHTRDSDERARTWAVEGLSILGSNESIQPLVDVLRNDPSITVRDRAASGLARSGMLTKSQRLSSVPDLIDLVGDSSLEAETRDLAYHTLCDITGKNIENDPTAWRSWWTEYQSGQ
jgi:hypothetical protein